MSNKNKSKLFNTDTGISRRNVLQGIGGLGAAGFAGVGSASTGGMGQLQMQSPSLGKNPAILVFSATAGYRHDAISEAIQTIKELANEIGNEGNADITVDVIRRDASQFPTSADELSKYDLVIWNFTTADVLDENQQDAFEAYIRNDGAYMGIHSAADTEYEWEFYGGLVGAYFEDHPVPQEAEVHITDRTHPSTDHLPPIWTKKDEWYDYRENPRGDVHVLATLDEQTYDGEGMEGFDHPIAWAQYYEGARSFYTGMGHTIDSYSNEMFRQHLKGGITWAAGYADDGASGTIWENYTKVPLATDTRAPAVVDIAPDGRVYFVDRAGFGTGLTEQAQVKMVDQNTPDNEVTTALDITVFNELEDGLLGMLLDSDFENTGYVYLYYSPPNKQIASNQEELEFLNNAATSDSLDGVPQPEAPVKPYNLLSRYTTNDDGTIDPDSETEILRVHTQRDTCCHTGGDMHWGPDGEQLYLTTGDNTNPFQSSGYTPIDERYGRVPFDAQRSAGNTNDLRGSILRIIPQEDGSYTVPDNNLCAQLSAENGGSGGNRGRDDKREDIDPSSDLPPVVGDAPPLDPDGDGLYEDVNGDGKVDHDDVAALFDHFEDSAVQDNPDAYDFNRNGRLDYDDIVELSSNDSVPALPEEVRPEIYTMGSRNPFRAAVDQETGTLYWGEYGPDASSWDPLRGPPGLVEFNKANGPGFYGWPYFHGPNIPYIDGEFATTDQGEIIFNSSGVPFDPTDPTNNSPNNNGLTKLPEPEEPLMYYTSNVSPEALLSGPEYAQPYLPNEIPYPELTGGGAPMAGPLYRRPENADPYRSLPESFDGKFFIMEWNENWIKYASFDEDGTVTEIDDFLPNMEFVAPMDMKYGPDGALYLVEWGSSPGGKYTTPNEDSGVYRIEHASPKIAPAIEFADNEVSVDPGTTTTVEGTLTNTTSSPLESGKITLSAPSDSGIEISNAQGTSFDSIPTGESHSVSWDVAVPNSASGTYTLTATATYTVNGRQVERTTSVTLDAGGDGGNDDGGGNDGGGGSGSNAIPAGTTIELGGRTSGWVGEAPSSIQGTTNPTLTLQEGESYTVTFENLDGAPHDFVLLDSQGNQLQGTQTVASQGGTATLEFTASSEIAEYYCSFHPTQMHGNIEIV